jgi:hypothetical protein
MIGNITHEFQVFEKQPPCMTNGYTPKIIDTLLGTLTKLTMNSIVTQKINSKSTLACA